MKKKGGIVRAIQQMVTWLLILTFCFIVSCHHYSRIKKNYTELHRRVSELEGKIFINH